MLLAVDSLPLSLLLLQQQAATASVLRIYSIDLSNLFLFDLFLIRLLGETQQLVDRSKIIVVYYYVPSGNQPLESFKGFGT
jgi:hypothetical protein